jgi:hypothetical protein
MPHRNRNLAMKLQHQQRRHAMEGTSDTPRTDRFIKRLTPTRLDPADFVDTAALVRTTVELRALMIAWGTFARELERELMHSVPKEWP